MSHNPRFADRRKLAGWDQIQGTWTDWTANLVLLTRKQLAVSLKCSPLAEGIQSARWNCLFEFEYTAVDLLMNGSNFR